MVADSSPAGAEMRGTHAIPRQIYPLINDGGGNDLGRGAGCVPRSKTPTALGRQLKADAVLGHSGI